MRRILWIGAVVLAVTPSVWAGEIDFIEDFALSTDRSVALKHLIPGTEDFYYYHALHYLNTEQFEKAQALIAPWVQRLGETPRVWEIRTRQALLTYEKNPQKSLEYLRARLGVQFLHQKEELNAEPNLPVALDPAIISRKQFVARANAVNQANLDGFEDSALDWLTGYDLNPNQRRSLLARLPRPDYANLSKLVVDDLNHEHSGGFGSLGIHRQLLLSQLEALLKLKPGLLTEQNFVVTYLMRLQPGPDEDWRHGDKAHEAYLDRLAAFAARLVPAHNSLMAHVLYHRLVYDRQHGKYDKERFLSYLKLPRRVGYLSKAMLESEAMKRFPGDLSANYDGATLMIPIVNDEPLVRSYLAHFFVDAASTKEFEPYINDVYLRHLFAETKIVNGLGESEQWASLLPPALFQQLKERIDIDFAFTNKRQFAADAPVTLDVHVKNVSTLIVKVFEINTQNYYREHQREVDTDVNLDGLVANVERTHNYTDPPLRRVTRRFEFPTLDRAGVYVIDFIGNGRSSRALVRKGRLHHLVRTSPAGQVFTVLDENHRQVKNATLWLAGHEYSPSENGLITVPFSTSPGRQAIVLSAPIRAAKAAERKPGDAKPADDKVVDAKPADAKATPDQTYSSLDHFQHEAETYALTAGFYVDREALLRRKTAEVVIRPGLTIGGTPVSLKLLDEVKLTITSTDLDGIGTSQEISNFELFEDREAIHEFEVPQRLSSISFALSAKVKQQSAGGQKIDLSAADSFSLNEIDRTERIEDLHLLKAAGQFVVELRGKTGESRASRPVAFSIKHRDFRQPVGVVLKTDPAGRIALGSLSDIAVVTATGPEGTAHSWPLVGDRHTYPNVVQARAGDPVVLPFLPKGGIDVFNANAGDAEPPAAEAPALSRDEVSLLELRGEAYVADRFQHLSVKNGLLVADKLPAGNFDLLLKSTGARVRIRVAQGEHLGRFVVGKKRQLETPALAPVQIESIVAGDEKLRIVLRNASKFTRVHLFATRYVPEYDAFGELSRVRGPEPYMFVHFPADSMYLTGRNIGDEYRYIIDRKYARKYPGNLLERPSLLLNPWAVRVTETGEQLAAGGDEFGAAGTPPASESARGASPAPQKPSPAAHFANLDFLAEASAVLVNLLPDKEGVIEIKRDALGDHQHIYAVAVDPLNTTCRTASFAEQAPTFADLRLLASLDAQAHFTQRKQISIVPAGQKFTLADITTSKFEAYDSLARVYGLYATLNRDPKLVEFAFVLNWPKLKAEEKQALYSKHACHELSFFLAKKDPEFFQRVIQPYLANKKDKTFVDRFLLDEDLSKFLLPWNYEQLNIVEQILLAQRVKDERPLTARHVGDLLALLPPDIDHFMHLFDTAVKTGSLEVEDVLGLKQAAEEAGRPAAILFRGGAMGGAMAPAAPPAAEPANRPADDKGKSESKALSERLAGRKESLKKSKSAAAARDGRSMRRLADKKADDSPRADEAKKDAEFFDANLDQREQLRQLYRKLDKTWEWAENNYHHLTIDQQNAGLVTVNAFWKDYAQHDPASPFISTNLAAASRNFSEMLMALAVLDLPFESPKHDTKFEGATMTLTAGGPLVVYHEQIQPAAAPDNAAKVLVSENFFRHGDRQRLEDGEPVDKFVVDEFLVHTVYGAQVVVTNPTSTRQKLTLLVQVPKGAIPVLNSQATRTVHMTLEPYHTQTLEYHFYFPVAGKFPHFPVHVARNETLVAAAAPLTLAVVDRPTKIDTESWDYVSQYASADEVLKFLSAHNVNALNLDKIAWRMHDAKVFSAVTDLLARRHVYQHTLWSYALLHNVVSAAREYLQHADQIVNESGGRLASPLLSIDPVARRTYEHLEYKPLVNARAHALGKRRQIVNDRFFEQYHRFLKELAHSKQLTDDDLVTVTYYLLLQDRIEEALAVFGRVNAGHLATRLQYDYCAAYLDFFTNDHARAREIAAAYAEHPVDRWRNTFAAIIAQLDEAEGKDAQTVDPEDRNQQQAKLAASEPSFEFTVDARLVKLSFQNLKSVRVNFYEMDVELLFSRNPFVHQFQGQFGAIRPNYAVDVKLPEKGTTHTIAFPPELANKNVLVEVVGAGETKTQAFYSHSLEVQVIENYGQVKVTHQEANQPAPKVYVKVYAQTADGQVKFYKDGYTDLRGRFDYASLNTNDLDVATKFSILILSDEFGAVVREATPPKR